MKFDENGQKETNIERLFQNLLSPNWTQAEEFIHGNGERGVWSGLLPRGMI